MAQYEITNEQIAEIDLGVKGIDRILQNCKNLLCTRRGEIPYDRRRGFDWGLFDLPIQELEYALMPELDRVMSWEELAEVVSGSVERTDEGEYIIRCVVEVKE